MMSTLRILLALAAAAVLPACGTPGSSANGASPAPSGGGGTVGGGATGGGGGTPSGAWPERVFAPYVDGGLWPTLGVLSDSVINSTGTKYFSLAFIVEDGWTALAPAWAGVYQVGSSDPVSGDQDFLSGIATVRSHGGDVIVSFGGASGKELAVAYSQAGKTAAQLQAAYQSVIDRYNLTYIDFDVEGAAVADPASVNLRSQAIRNLQDAAAATGRTLNVSLTLPVLPSGLDNNGLAVLQSAQTAGVTLRCVNIMAMDYGSAAIGMGQAAVDAGNSLIAQLSALYPSLSRASICRMVGMTPMIGVNDTSPEVFTLADAAVLASWADTNDIRLLSMWSFNRDHAGTSLSPTDSGISQSDFAFTQVFVPFTQ